MRGSIAIAVIVGFVLPAYAQPPTPQSERTASWYADRPEALAKVTRVCQNDPGHGRNNPDCINAEQARVMVAQRDIANHVDLTAPTDPNYWRARPLELRQQLFTCRHIPAEYQRQNNCASVFTAAGSR